MGPFESFLAELESRGASPHTVKGYASDLRRFRLWYESRVGHRLAPREVGELHIAEFRRDMCRRRCPATVNRALSALRAFFAWAAAEGLADGNPAEGVRFLEETSVGPRALGRNEQMALVRAARQSDNPRDFAIIVLFLHAGLRVSELVNLSSEDVKVGARSGSLTVRYGKRGRSRVVPLNATARQALLRYSAVRGDAPGPFFLKLKRDPGRLGRHGEGVGVRTVERLVRNCARRAGLEKVTPHVLRHTFCKSLMDASVSLDKIAVLAGHASVRTTARYTYPTMADLEDAAETIAWT